MSVTEAYYFNFLLFVPIFLFRRISTFFKLKIVSENFVNTNFLNKFFKNIFRVDIALAKKIHPPFGVSSFILATK
jgi:hypothetical protein